MPRRPARRGGGCGAAAAMVCDSAAPAVELSTPAWAWAARQRWPGEFGLVSAAARQVWDIGIARPAMPVRPRHRARPGPGPVELARWPAASPRLARCCRRGRSPSPPARSERTGRGTAQRHTPSGSRCGPAQAHAAPVPAWGLAVGGGKRGRRRGPARVGSWARALRSARAAAGPPAASTVRWQCLGAALLGRLAAWSRRRAGVAAVHWGEGAAQPARQGGEARTRAVGSRSKVFAACGRSWSFLGNRQGALSAGAHGPPATSPLDEALAHGVKPAGASSQPGDIGSHRAMAVRESLRQPAVHRPTGAWWWWGPGGRVPPAGWTADWCSGATVPGRPGQTRAGVVDLIVEEPHHGLLRRVAVVAAHEGHQHAREAPRAAGAGSKPAISSLAPPAGPSSTAR